MSKQVKEAPKTGKAKGDIGKLSLSSMLKPRSSDGGGWESLAMELIDEDPSQPRQQDSPGFTKESIEALAATIADRGLKTPISVRKAEVAGRYIINHGHRRFRAVQQLGHASIRAYIDNDYTDDDQVIENVQRNNLTPRELADYIGRKRAQGKKNAEIARKLGLSEATISQHATLLDLPPVLAEAFNAGRVQDITILNDLVRAHRKDANEVENWLSYDEQEITRGTVKDLIAYLNGDKRATKRGADLDGAGGEGEPEQESPKGKKAKKEGSAPNPDKLKKAILRVRFKGANGQLMLNKRPPAEGFAWVKYDEGGEEVEASLKMVELLALIEA